jgi:hypothetical protein
MSASRYLSEAMQATSLERSPLLGWPAAAAVLIVFWIGMLASLSGTSQTFDEGVHVTAGYTFWRYNDYRLNPENGNLPQRVMALPLLFGDYKFAAADSDLWRTSDKWGFTWQWFYQLGNNAEEMTQRGRACIGLLAVALGGLVWAWSRQLFGPLGGMLSLLLFVFNPSILANGALMTSDTASALFFFAATWAWWRMLHEFTIARVLASAFVMAGLFVSKMSAPLIVAVALALTVLRLIHGTPLPTRGFGLAELRRRREQLLLFAGAAAFHAVIVLTVIWGFHGFRFSAFSSAMPEGTWAEATWETLLNKPAPITTLERVGLGSQQREEVKRIFARERADLNSWSIAAGSALEQVKHNVLAEEQAARLDQFLAEPPAQFFPKVLETVRRYRLLPEAYIYGFAHVWRGTRERGAFFNGDFSLSGWRTFFPYTFVVKTPLSLFVVIALALGAGLARARSGRARNFALAFHHTSPLWVLFGFYWAAAIASHLNIGHRHILPTYPPLFVLCGVAVSWLKVGPAASRESKRQAWPLARAAGVALGAAVALLVTEICYRFPHYLAYFNGVVRPARAYRHLVDSSLDWGQDLPGVRRYIEARHITGAIYLSYYGFASPVYYQVPAIHTYSFTGWHRTPPLQFLRLPDGASDEALNDFMRREPEYDNETVGRALRDGKDLAVVVKKPEALRLASGTYFISATLLQPITEPGRGAFGPWNARLEQRYQILRQQVAPLLSDDLTERNAALARLPAENWIESINAHEYLRFRRLAAFLRQREPDDSVGYSILVYHITADDLSRALDGPPVELGRDILSEIFPHAQ